MKTATEELQAYLTHLEDAAFLDFYRKIDFGIDVRINGSRGGTQVVHQPLEEAMQHCEWNIADYRGGITETILQYKHSDPAMFEKVLRTAEIRADDGRALAMSNDANKVSRDARLIAIAAIFLTLAQMLPSTFYASLFRYLKTIIAAISLYNKGT
jgi:hypothetical protein